MIQNLPARVYLTGQYLSAAQRLPFHPTKYAYVCGISGQKHPFNLKYMKIQTQIYSCCSDSRAGFISLYSNIFAEYVIFPEFNLKI